MNQKTDPRSTDTNVATLKLSVLMPVYNAMPYLEDAVLSILSQTYSDFEFIIIDDGSTDDSLALLKKLAAEDSRIQLISRKNKGIVATRNSCSL